jgi:two-component system sensor histidine kinase/response regulator
MDGLEVAQAIAQEPAIADVRMVLLTAIGQRRAARRASRKTGVAAFLSKPLRLDRLETCLLNLFDAPTAEVAQPRRREERVAQRTIPILGHVLVAEDDPVSQKVALRLLEKRGYRVDVVGNGRSAVDACMRRAYDLVLMDCRLPELDGFEATKEIRRREPSTRGTPIVALTASTALQQRCLDAGMSGHLAKPLRTDALDAVLREWIAPRADAAPVTNDDEVLDTPGLLDRVDGDLDFVRELALGLRDDRPRWLDELQSGLASHDAARVEHAAHAICGSAANLGGRRAAALAREIETRAHAGDLAPCGAMLAGLAGALEQLEHALLGLDRRHLAAS